MAKINGIVVCNVCASTNVQCLGHGGYKQGPTGFGDQKTMVGYQCQQPGCRHVWSE